MTMNKPGAEPASPGGWKHPPREHIVVLYGGFWRRLGAVLIDLIVLLPLFVIVILLESQSRHNAMAMLVPGAVIGVGYFVWCHGLYGRTPGKYLVGLRVVRADGEPIGLTDATVRSLPDIVCMAFGAASRFLALLAITDSEYIGDGSLFRDDPLAAHMPAWGTAVFIAAFCWYLADAIVLAASERKQSLHDRIAGTVVIRDCG